MAELGRLAAAVGGRVEGNADFSVAGLRTLEEAGPEDLAFVTSPRYAAEASASHAGVLLVDEKLSVPGKVLLRHSDPYFALSLLVPLFYPEPADEPETGLVSAHAVLDPAARKKLIDQLVALAFAAMGLAGKGRYQPHLQQHLLVGVVVGDTDQRAAVQRHNAQFLLQLPRQGQWRSLARLTLAARKLPQPALVLVARAFGDEYLARRIADDGRDHVYALHGSLQPG